MRLRERSTVTAMRCGRCGYGVAFDGIVDLGDDAQPGFQVLAVFRCRICGHGFMDLMDRSRALDMEGRSQPAAMGALP